MSEDTGAGASDDGVIKRLLKKQEDSSIDVLGNVDAEDLEPLHSDVNKLEGRMLEQKGSLQGKLFVEEEEDKDAEQMVKQGFWRRLAKGVYEVLK